MFGVCLSSLGFDLLKPLEQHGSKRPGEGSQCHCKTPQEHEALVERVNESFKQDKYRGKNAPTSESLIKKARATTNGHSPTTTV